MSEPDDLFAEIDGGSDHDFATNKREIVKSPFGWAGGKSKCLDKILPHLPYYKGFCEPFCGSAAVTLARTKSPLEILNDRYSGITDFYRCLRDSSKCNEMIELLNLFIHSREEWYNCYENWEKQKDPVVRAAMWYYMIMYSFAKRGDAFGRSTYVINVTSGLHLRKSLGFRQVHERISAALIENLDFRQIFKDFSHPETVFYCDPPYMETSHHSYFGNFFKEKDHIDLLECAFKSSSFVAISNHKNELYDFYEWDRKIEWEQYRPVNKPDLEDLTELRERDTVHRTEVLYIKERK